MRHFAILLLASILTISGFCQTKANRIEGKSIKQVEIRDASDKPILIPQLGKKNLLIFYVDPDHSRQNKEFRENLEKKQINSPNIHAFGIINLKDAPLMPNAVIRTAIRQKAKATHSTIYTDPDYLLRNAWGLGDVNDKFVLIFVNRDSVIEFYRAGELSKADIEQFYRVINKYR